MKEKTKITLTSRLAHEFSSNIKIDDRTYHVQTEDMGKKSCKIITNIFSDGEIVNSKKSDYSHLMKLKDPNDKISAMLEKQHKSVIDSFIADQGRLKKTQSDYFSEVKYLLKQGKPKTALALLREGLDKYESDPFLMTYYGCLTAILESNAKEGIRLCEKAIERLNESMPFGSEFFYPVFYLNLGRAYLKGRRKTDAIKAFQKGLKSDPENIDILSEMNKLGSRKKPPLSFLNRSNPINKYIGMLLNRPHR